MYQAIIDIATIVHAHDVDMVLFLLLVMFLVS